MNGLSMGLGGMARIEVSELVKRALESLRRSRNGLDLGKIRFEYNPRPVGPGPAIRADATISPVGCSR
jgi:hypothetical protein